MTKENNGFDKNLIRELALLLDETNLSEIELEQKDFRIRVARELTIQASVASHYAPAPAAAPVAAAAPAAAPAEPAKHPGMVPSPMVGTAYLSPEPGARAFVEVGAAVKEGQTVLIVEAMKTMNQIPAPRSGVLKQVLVTDAQPVEYGEPLFIIE
ncbi:acetyl-CoA carboxylase biotin carboxyl carrier protein [Pannonibacter sp. Q-1]|uniref:Biotin carboxyl carrier protein of acetyl-CoA carboxylase n=1 Tax=Pannonibacter phragmitetus TaxID=121719 RepID=A0A0L0IYY6_9HYPH|nr:MULTISPECIES: acetyl-CoA carboxylase biotin carboxyl carrier protein [Pannonibacter]ALV28607.1 acetyl-CoA carboxylase biotin carboxyl carrier protein subunit [Pannonibacter phragmitetus]KND18676.1 acetyl-CoA carboxylase [Pannonibacter phragmitetus]MBA4207356.1 acetyl-CoA carboxylase biotin carboxyl carrier protein [Polymorphum sp.]SUB01427.1 Biotin carboxyl carrier protein of acetyl-CoA carboxylase [Pannonibacter phragmitetus]